MKANRNVVMKCYLLVSVFLLIFSLHIFYTSLHNVDICQNDIRLEQMVKDSGVNIDIMELNVDFEGVDVVKCYLSGLKWTLYSVYSIILSSVLLGFVINEVGRK